jgi:hypothetical protein
LLPLRDALGRRTNRTTIEVIAPPYPCAGAGVLRVVRAVEDADSLALTAAYERYDRL